MPKATKYSQKKPADNKSFRFTEPVVRVLKDKSKAKFAKCGQSKPSQSSNNHSKVAVFHKRKEKSDHADIVGIRGLNMWKKSCGHGKSWRVCKRLKVTQDYVELLTNSNGHPVSFGWGFSATNAPASFIRGQNLHVNHEPKSRRKNRLSRLSYVRDLGEEDGSSRLQPEDLSEEDLTMSHEIQQQETRSVPPIRSLRIFIGPGTFRTTEEAFPKQVSSHTSRSSLAQAANFPRQVTVDRFTFLDLVRTDNLADVYSVRHSYDVSQSYLAYIFLNEGTGNNWMKFRQRKMNRMRQSNDFFVEIFLLNRHVIVMRDNDAADASFRTKNMKPEFPPLNGTGEKPCRSPKKLNKGSYAAVLKAPLPAKKKIKYNSPAYKAWQERRAHQEPMKDSTADSRITESPRIETEDFVLVSYKRKTRRIF